MYRFDNKLIDFFIYNYNAADQIKQQSLIFIKINVF